MLFLFFPIVPDVVTPPIDSPLVIVSGNWSQSTNVVAGTRGQGLTIASGDWNEERVT